MAYQTVNYGHIDPELLEKNTENIRNNAKESYCKMCVLEIFEKKYNEEMTDPSIRAMRRKERVERRREMSKQLSGRSLGRP